MRVAMAQINTTVGDFDGNTRKVLDSVKRAAREGADLVVFPEMCLCGYPPLDLLDYEPFVDENLRQVRRIQQAAPGGIGIVVGYMDRSRSHAGKSLLNVASLICDGRVLHSQAKTLLPTYDVFDEARYFEPASERRVVNFGGKRLGVALCEDLWWESEPKPGLRYTVDPVAELLDQGAELILAPSASPFHAGKLRLRCNLLERIGKSSGVPVIYTNLVGGNDNLVFDGRSMATAADGGLIALARGFEEDLVLVDTEAEAERLTLEEDKYAEVEAALVLGLADYLEKCGLEKVNLGLSGGIDSAVVAAVAVRAVGPEHVTAFSMPSPYSSPGSVEDAKEMAKNLGIRLISVPITGVFSSFLTALEPVLFGTTPDVTEENLQSRVRGTLLMAYSNKYGTLLLATGNKSELATGYCTMYGDMNGGLAVIGDLLKTEVYELARHINRREPLIPQAIIDKPPSAELKPGQTDQDSLPEYALLDRVLSLYLLENLTLEQIVRRGVDRELAGRILRMVGRAEYKRRQAPPVLKVSARAFGTGRRMPIARRIFEA